MKISILKVQVCRPTLYKILNVDLSNIYKEMIILFPFMFSRFINSTIASDILIIESRIHYSLAHTWTVERGIWNPVSSSRDV